jgi:beta-xylosidase
MGSEGSVDPAEQHWPPAPTYPWFPDQRDGTYLNPILCADYSDPDVIRHGEAFYLTASSFNCTPALPILHSRDLVNWTIVNHAVENLPHPRFEQVQHGCGVWAPAIRFHAGMFYIFFPMPDEGIYVVTAKHPADRWSPPHMVQAGKGLIDPCPLWDDDGNAFLVYAYAGSRAGIKHKLRVCPMAPDASQLLGPGQIVFEDPERHPTLEGPKFLKKDGWYYILAPAGGVATGWQLALRSRSIYGPYTPRVVLEQGSTPVNGPHQGALVDLPGGGWWFVHFQELQPYGRIVHLQPVTWQDGWPLMGVDRDGNGIGEPVAHHRKPSVDRAQPLAAPQTSDEFDDPSLGLQWQWQANHRREWYSLTARSGWLRLFAVSTGEKSLHLAPNLFLQKLPARVFTVETCVAFAPKDAGQRAGLVVMGRQHAAVELRRSHAGIVVALVVNGTEVAVREVSAAVIDLRVEMQDGGACTFGFSVEGRPFEPLGAPFRAVEGQWIGAKVGLFCTAEAESAGFADFDYFRFSPGKSAVALPNATQSGGRQTI